MYFFLLETIDDRKLLEHGIRMQNAGADVKMSAAEISSLSPHNKAGEEAVKLTFFPPTIILKSIIKTLGIKL